MKEVLQNILNISPNILLPIIIVCISIFMKMKIKDAIISGLTLAIAFTSVSLVMNFMFDTVSPVAIQFVKNTNINLSVLDIGFSPMVAISFAWPLAVFMFPLQIGINIFMIHFNLTNVLNVDIFNIWTKIFTASIIALNTNNIFLGFVAATIQIIIELKVAEKVKNRVKEISKVEGTTCSHLSAVQTVIMFPLNNFLDRFSFIKNVNLDVESLKKRIGIFGQDSVMGLIIGLALSLLAGYSFGDSLEIAIKVATTLVLMPITSSLFIKALNPVSEVAKNYMENKYKGRDISIGLDWPILSASQELWIVSILLIPITLVMAVVLSKFNLSNILPLPGIVNVIVVVPALIIANRNILKMLIISTIITPIYLMVTTYFAPSITELAKNSHTINVKAGQLVSYYCMEAPFFRWSLNNFLKFKIYGIISFGMFIILFIHFYNKFDKEREVK